MQILSVLSTCGAEKNRQLLQIEFYYILTSQSDLATYTKVRILMDMAGWKIR